MATNTLTKEDSLTHIKTLIKNPNYHQFSDLSPEEEQYFAAIFIFNQGQFGPYTFDSPADAFSAFKENPEILDTLFLPENDILHQSEAIDRAILTRLVAEHQLSQEQIRTDIEKRNPKLTQKQINLLIKIYLINQARLSLDQLKKSPPDTHTTSTIISQSNPKKDPHQTINELGNEIANLTAAAAGIKITEEQAIKFSQILTASTNLTPPPPETPIRQHLEVITNPEVSPSEQLAATYALVQTLAPKPELISEAFGQIRTSPVETTKKEQLVQALDRAISTQNDTTSPPIITSEALVTSLQNISPQSLTNKLPPESPLQEHLETITNPQSPLVEKVTSAESIISSPPSERVQFFEAVKNSDLPPPTKADLLTLEPKNHPSDLITTLQQTPDISDAINHLPPDTPGLKSLKIITDTYSPPSEQLSAASDLINTLQSPENYSQFVSSVKQSSLPLETKGLLSETINQSTQQTPPPNPEDLETIKNILQNNPEISTPLQSITSPELPSDISQTSLPIDPVTLEATLALTTTTNEYNSPVANLTREVAAATDPINTLSLPHETNPVNPSTQTSFDLESIISKLPSDQQIEQSESSFGQKLATTKPDIKELTLQFVKETQTITHNLAVNPATADIIDQISPTANPEFADKLILAIRHDLPVISTGAFSDLHSAQAEAIATGLGHHNIAAGIKIHALIKPDDLKTAVEFAHTHPDSELGKLLKENPQKFFSAVATTNQVAGSTLGEEINTNLNRTTSTTSQSSSISPQLTPIQNIFQKITSPFKTVFNRVSSFFNNKIPQIPGIGKYLNAVTHPVQFIKNWVGRKIGENFVKQIGQRIGQAVLKRIGNEFAKKAVNTLLKEGLKKAAQLILKQAAIRGLQVAAQALNAVPGLGIAVAIALEIGSRIIGKIKGALDNLAMSIWGEKLKARDLGAAAGALIAAPVAVAVAIATAAVTTAATTISATIIIAAAIGGFFYLSAVTIAPIIGSFAQLGNFDRGLYPGQPAVISNDFDLTNISQCPSGHPVPASSPITQQHLTGTHEPGIWTTTIGQRTFATEGEAVDYGVRTGTLITATHDGQAYYYPDRTNSPYGFGNWIAIVGSCTDQTTNQSYTFVTIYAHLLSSNLPPGGPTQVRKGNTIGYSDKTGYTIRISDGDGSHLHYEIIGLGDINRYL